MFTIILKIFHTILIIYILQYIKRFKRMLCFYFNLYVIKCYIKKKIQKIFIKHILLFNTFYLYILMMHKNCNCCV